MGAEILQIKSKIKSTKTTKKITKAMELVSASKMRQFQKKALLTQEFEKELDDLINTTLHSEFENVYFEKRRKAEVCFILYTSDKGLCGALNIKLIKTLINSKEWIETPEDKRILITIGKKGFEYAKNNNIKVRLNLENIDEKINHSNSVSIIDKILSFWEEGLVSEMYMIVPRFKNSLVYYPTIKKYLPIDKTNKLHEEGFDEDFYNPNIVYEPNPQEFLDSLFHKLIFAKFYSGFMELKATEYSSRMIAMQNATKSASDVIDKLSLRYNNARQAAITQEIAEIVSGSNKYE